MERLFEIQNAETSEIEESEKLVAIDLVIQRIVLSERQSGEWGLRAVKALFGSLRLPKSSDSEK